ncbi:polysaccharide biosynthesis tyrosine autokinase [Microbacterium esteraromaticum]|uniref:polysaccharide biosynthesis tyrosine autokinase n=1 Tax=Microbacterium esteraromaticum TaxID=57043 RepID=UPI00195A3B4A|nr:capsular exopolysaccharide synthesis family protein [Microbacterium esteraromaticum]
MTVLEFFTLIRRGWRVLLIGAMAGILVGVGYFFLTPKVYEARATGFIASSSEDSLVSGSDEATARASSYVALITSGTVREAIAEELGEEPGSLQGALSARVVPGSTLIEVTAQASSPGTALKLASGALDGLTTVIDQIESKGGQASKITVVPLDDAAEPSAPVAPNLRFSVILGGVGGLVAGLIVLLLRRVLDVKVRTHTDMSELMGTGVLGRVPKLGKKGTAPADSRVANIAKESFRQIRTGLRFSSVDAEVRTVMITSANQGEGKSTVAASLAEVFAAAGQRTIIVDADMRRPKVARNFKVDGSVGLSGVLSGQVSVATAVQATSDPNLFVLPAGAVPPNPSEMLGSAALKNLLAELSRDFFVIIDAPPVLPVTDASIISTMVDGVVYVSATGTTRKAAVGAARTQLEQVGARVLGVVLNFVSLKDEGGYGYGYGYYRQNSSYYLTPEKPKKGKKKTSSEQAAARAPQPVAPIVPATQEPEAMRPVQVAESEAPPLRRRSRA